jgi:hypothetical protein
MSAPRFQKGDRVYIRKYPGRIYGGQTGTVVAPDHNVVVARGDDPMYWVAVQDDAVPITARYNAIALEPAPTPPNENQEITMTAAPDEKLAETNPDKYRRLTLAHLITKEMSVDPNAGHLGPAGGLRIANLLLTPSVLNAIGLTDDEIIALGQRHTQQRDEANRKRVARERERSDERDRRMQKMIQELNAEYPDLAPLHVSGPAMAD